MAEGSTKPDEIKSLKKKILIIGIVIIGVIAVGIIGAVYLWNNQNWNKYCSDKFPGSTYNTTTNICEIPSQAAKDSGTSVAESISTVAQETKGTVDSIIGVWRLIASNGFDERWRFNADGTFVMSFYSPDEMKTQVVSGTWSSQGGNTYVTNTIAGFFETIVYDPDQNAIYNLQYPALVMTPYTGSVATASPTTSSSGSTSKSLSFSGTGDDIRSFSVSGGGGFIVSGTNAGRSNFIVHITDHSGDVEEFVFNEIGPYSGKKIIHLDQGSYYLDVKAEGPWTITLTSA